MTHTSCILHTALPLLLAATLAQGQISLTTGSQAVLNASTNFTLAGSGTMNTWVGVAVARNVPVSSSWRVAIGGAISNAGAPYCEFVLANGHLGAVTPIIGNITRTAGTGGAYVKRCAVTPQELNAHTPRTWNPDSVARIYEFTVPQTATWHVGISGSAYLRWRLYEAGSGPGWRSRSSSIADGNSASDLWLSTGNYAMVVFKNDAPATASDAYHTFVDGPFPPPTPTLGSISRSRFTVDHPTPVLSIAGSQLTDGVMALINGVAYPTTFVSATQVTLTLPQAVVAQIGSYTLRLTYPNGGPTSTGYASINIDPIRVRLSIKRVISPTSASAWVWGPCVYQCNDIRRWRDDMRTIMLDRAGIAVENIEFIDLVDPGFPASWRNIDLSQRAQYEAAAEALPTVYYWRSNAINVYLVDSIASPTSLCSFPPSANNDNDAIFVSPDTLNGPVGFAHEIGHFLKLRHTHANFEGNALGCAGGPAGDCIVDTRSDTDPALCLGASSLPYCHNANFLNHAAVNGYSGPETNAVYRNVMSWHGPINLSEVVITPAQVRRLHEVIYTARQAVMIP